MRVPGYTGAPEVTPQAGPATPFLSAEGGSPDAFGAQIGEGLSRLGAGLGQVGDTLAQHALAWQDLKNDTEARDADVKGMETIGQLTADYNSKQGKDAVDAYPGYIQAVQKVRTDLSASMSNETSKKMFDDVFVRRVGYAISNGAEHSATQQKAYAVGTAKARIELTQQSAAVNFNDDKHFADSLGSIRSDAAWAQSQTSDNSPEAIKLAQNNAVSTAWGLRLQQMAMTDPARAQKLFTDNKDALTPEAQDAVGKMIHTQYLNIHSREVADSVIGGGANADYYSALRQQESGGNDQAHASTSSAYGRYQPLQGTWDAVRKAHPELGLTANGRGDPDQQEKFIHQFTADNQAVLQGANLPVNGKTLYIMHFMGAGGGKSFLQKVRDDPNASAASLFPDSAAANQSVFYKKDGDPRTVQEVFEYQTRRFSASGDAMSTTTTPGQLESMLKAGAERAEADAPGDEQFAGAVQTRIKSQYNTIKSAQADTEKANFQSVQDAVYGHPEAGQPPPTDLNKLLSVPEVAKAWNSLTPEHQEAMRKALEENAKPKAPTGAQRDAMTKRFQELSGMADNDPAGFVKLPIVDDPNLSRADKQTLINRQRSINTAATREPAAQAVNDAARYAARVAEMPGIARDASPEDIASYNVFTAQLAQAAREHLDQTKKPMTPAELRTTASQILRDATVQTPGYFGSSVGAGTEYQFVPKAVEDQIRADLRAKGNDNPTALEIEQGFEVPAPIANAIRRGMIRSGVAKPTSAQIFAAYRSRSASAR